ncbi:MAG: N-acetyltransferase [Flavobacteriales bacterium]|nr:N-acetyltransferase [Flavobacteriales bacterium]
MVWKVVCHNKKLASKTIISDSIDLVRIEDWKQTNYLNNIYLTSEYLSAIEETVGQELDFRYLQFYSDNNSPIGMAVVQIVNLKDSVENHEDVLCAVKQSIRKKLVNTIDARVIVCGNLFSCGENGFSFHPDVELPDALSMLNAGLKRIKESENIKENQISYYLLKEFWPDSFEKSDYLRKHDFRDFMIDANMILPIHKSWSNFEDYLASMTTKFRTKAKSALKRSNVLSTKELDHIFLERNAEKIQELYSNVIDQADFKIGSLTGESFSKLKKNLGQNFLINGYFLDEKLVGFSACMVINNHILDANYVGIDYGVNRDLALYQRMLYDMVECAIAKGFTEVRYGRTAEELKSSLGAQPRNMKLYIKHRNHISNQLLKPMIAKISPTVFDSRYPFKAEFSFS